MPVLVQPVIDLVEGVYIVPLALGPSQIPHQPILAGIPASSCRKRIVIDMAERVGRGLSAMSMVAYIKPVTEAFLVQVLAADTGGAERAVERWESEACVDLGRLWCGLSYLLGDELVGSAVCGRHEVEGTDMGFGPLRYFTPAEVGEISAALQQVRMSQIEQRFVPEVMELQEVYPNVWRSSDLDDLKHLLEVVKKSYRRAFERGEAVITYLS